MAGLSPNLRMPTREEIREVATNHYMDLNEQEIDYLKELIEDTLTDYERIDELPLPEPERRYTDRNPGYRPGEDEDPLNAFVRKCRVEGADDGPLSGYTVGLKDHIALAGIEMTWGTKVMEGYVPSEDATVVTWLLDAGATITGKLNLSACMFSGVTSELTATGPVHNPVNPDYSPGGSSSGSAAAVVNGDVDMALGGDQGGSIRIPAAWSGCVGLKPTHGLVPYTGCIAADETIDHIGPMTRTVEDCALMLEAIAGYDPNDPRQSPGTIETQEYTEMLSGKVDDLTIGILEQGFSVEGADERVNESVREAVDRFTDLGAEVTEVSVPWHDDGMALWNALAFGGIAARFRNDGVSHFLKNGQDPGFAVAFGKGRRVRGDEFPPLVKLAVILGQYVADTYQGSYYAKARKLVDELQAAYDESLEEVDLLAMPTCAILPVKIKEGVTPKETITRGVSTIPNNGQFNLTGHPGLSVPCDMIDGLPVGLQLVGAHFDDGTLLRAAHAFEQNYDWTEI